MNSDCIDTQFFTMPVLEYLNNFDYSLLQIVKKLNEARSWEVFYDRGIMITGKLTASHNSTTSVESDRSDDEEDENRFSPSWPKW